MSEKKLKKELHEDQDFAVWLGQKKFDKNFVDTKVDITGIIKLVIQQTKRLKFGATLIVSLVEDRDFLLTEFNLLKFNLFL